MPLLYGEGQKAFYRLQMQIMDQLDDDSLFAWQDQWTGESVPHGLLARTPAKFATCGNIVCTQNPSRLESPPIRMTSRGAEIFAELSQSSHKDTHGSPIFTYDLSCAAAVDKSLYLDMRVGGDLLQNRKLRKCSLALTRKRDKEPFTRIDAGTPLADITSKYRHLTYIWPARFYVRTFWSGAAAFTTVFTDAAEAGQTASSGDPGSLDNTSRESAPEPKAVAFRSAQPPPPKPFVCGARSAAPRQQLPGYGQRVEPRGAQQNQDRQRVLPVALSNLPQHAASKYNVNNYYDLPSRTRPADYRAPSGLSATTQGQLVWQCAGGGIIRDPKRPGCRGRCSGKIVWQDAFSIVPRPRDIVATLIKQGAYNSALQAAAYEGDEKVVDTLIDRGADASIRRGLFGNALQAASYGGSEKVAEKLLERGADVNAEGEWYNALQAASYKGHVNLVKLLIDRGAKLDAQGGLYGTALQAASYACHGKVVEMLLERGADVNAHGGDFGTALHAASVAGHESVLKLLLDVGKADAQSRDVFGRTPLFCCTMSGNESLIPTLYNTQVNRTNPSSDNTALVAPDRPDLLGCSFIHVCAIGNSSYGMRLAVDHTRNVNMRDNQDWTALHWCAYFGSTKTALILLQQNADLTLSDWRAWTPYDVAKFSGHNELAARLHPLDPREEAETNYESDASNIPGRFHNTAICDSCGHALLETHHHCTVCTDYGLCFRCIRDVKAFHAEHTFDADFRY